MSGAQRFGERSPERVQASVGHLQEPADVGRLVAVEEEIRGWRVAVVAVEPSDHPTVAEQQLLAASCRLARDSRSIVQRRPPALPCWNGGREQRLRLGT